MSRRRLNGHVKGSDVKFGKGPDRVANPDESSWRARSAQQISVYFGNRVGDLGLDTHDAYADPRGFDFADYRSDRVSKRGCRSIHIEERDTVAHCKLHVTLRRLENSVGKFGSHVRDAGQDQCKRVAFHGFPFVPFGCGHASTNR